MYESTNPRSLPTPTRINSRRPTPGQLINKLLKAKIKGRTLKVVRKKLFITYKKPTIKSSAYFTRNLGDQKAMG